MLILLLLLLPEGKALNGVPFTLLTFPGVKGVAVTFNDEFETIRGKSVVVVVFFAPKLLLVLFELMLAVATDVVVDLVVGGEFFVC